MVEGKNLTYGCLKLGACMNDTFPIAARIHGLGRYFNTFENQGSSSQCSFADGQHLEKIKPLFFIFITDPLFYFYVCCKALLFRFIHWP